MRKVKAFFAYSSERQDLLEDIRSAVRTINNSQEILITTWEELPIGGNSIIKGILDAIDECDLFICDLTTMNLNVLYELGYAIAKEKKVWITLNTSHAEAETIYKRSHILTTIGYAGYSNSQELESKFFSELPHEKTQSLIRSHTDIDYNRNLVHIKCIENTSSSNVIQPLLKKSQIPTKTDDPYEGPMSLGWYLSILPNSLGIIIHFHTMKSENNDKARHGKKAMIAGLAKGFDAKALLLAHDEYNTPLDFFDSMKIHTTSSQCEGFVEEWLNPIIENYNEGRTDFQEYRAEQKAIGRLSGLIMGDFVAENENEDLLEYFLETAEYKEALDSQQVLFVGRKGTGKTANLLKLRDELSADKRNLTVTIQPQGYEFEGVLNVLDELIHNSEQGHLIESLLEYLIYTEIAKQHYENLESMPLHIIKTEEENELCGFIEKNQRYINADFTLRLVNIIEDLRSLNQTKGFEQQRLKVSEFLHETMISHLRRLLGKSLSKRERVNILIDNLDKGWNNNSNLSKMGNLLFGLLNVIHKITDEFHKDNYLHEKVNLSLIVFLRTDIFSRIISFAPERDKIPFKYLSWSEPSLLFKVIENRIEYGSSGITSPEDLWTTYFCKEVKGVPLKEYVENLILPRPRDIVFLFKTAIQKAVNNGHPKVEEDDFISAEYLYSDYALQSLLPENGGRVERLDELLYEFAGEKSIINYEELTEILSSSHKQHNPEDLIKVLCEMTFLAQEVQEGTFQYYSEKRSTKITDKLASKLANERDGLKRYQINPAFYKYLEIEKVESLLRI